MIKKVLIYCRVSTDMQEEKNSLEFQIKRCKDEIERNENFELLEILSDVESGAHDNRPDFIKLQNMIKSKDKKPDVIIVTELSRISRKLVKLIEFMEICNSNNVEFISLTQKIDTSSPGGRAMFSLLGTFSQFEREQISERVKNQKMARIKSGTYQGGKIPYGYTNLNPGELTVDFTKAEHVKDIFGMFIAGKTLKDIGRKYEIDDKVIRNMLTNPVYSGFYRYNRRNRDLNSGKAKYSGKEFLVKGNHIAIISEETFKTVQEIMKNKYVKKIRTVDNDNFLLGGLLQCHCGRKLYGTYNTAKTHYYYACTRQGCNKKRVRSKEFETALINEMKSLKGQPELFSFNENNEESKDLFEKLKRNDDNILKLGAKKKKLIKMHLDELITEQEFNSNASEISKEINAIVKDTEFIKTKIEYKEAKVTNKDLFMEMLDKLDTLDVKELKQVLRILIDRVEFEDDTHYKIYYNV